MTPRDLHRELQLDYDVICFEDLGDLVSSHRRLFDLFKSVYQTAYAPMQRLVLYTDSRPAPRLLNHVQRAASRIDISNCFILIVCPHDIRSDLTQANLDFGTDAVTIQSLIYPVIDTKKYDLDKIADTKYLCPLPFAQVHVDRIVRPCCKAQQVWPEIQAASIDQIFQNDLFQQMRRDMIEGRAPDRCSICWHAEQSGTQSHRQLAMQKYGDRLDQEWLDDPQIRDVTIAPSSLCNFKCRICGPWASTSWATEEIQASNTDAEKAVYRAYLRTYNDQDLIDSILARPQLEYLHVMGGEPLIWNGLEPLINGLVQDDRAKKISLEFNTNASVFPESIMRTMAKCFRSVEILLSIDNIGTRFEIERGGHWPDILTNVKKFVALKSSNVTVMLAPTVNIQNVLYLETLLDLANELGVAVVWHYLENPSFLCVDHVTDRVKTLVDSLYHDHTDPNLRNIALRIKHSLGSDGKQFIAYSDKLDQRRNQKFAETHAELYRAMNTCSATDSML